LALTMPWLRWRLKYVQLESDTARDSTPDK
jgi:hypothetical protein